MHEYKVNIVKVVDGDTVDVDIDLGFGMWLRNERVRVMGIDTPESRTSDKIEKIFGLAAKNRLRLITEGTIHWSEVGAESFSDGLNTVQGIVKNPAPLEPNDAPIVKTATPAPKATAKKTTKKKTAKKK